MRKLLPVIAMCLLAVACGKKEPASPLDVMPDAGVLQMAFSDPASIVANLDAYIAEGVPIAGPNLIMSQILAATDAENVDSLAAWLGLDIHGPVALYMVGVNPQTIGAAAAVTDPEAFWARTTEWGVEWTDAEPIGEAVVKTFASGQMTLNAAIYRDCLLLAASRAELSTMIDRIEGRAPSAVVPALEPGTLWIKADVTTFGPMAAGQLAMYRPEIMSGIEYGGTSGMPGSEAMAASMLGLYFDLFDTLLRETKTVEYTITFGPDEVKALASAVWVEGSSLATNVVPVEATDYTSVLPSAGAIVVGRMALAPELSKLAMTAVFEALGASPGQDYIDLSAEMCRNTSFALYNDAEGPMHMVGVYGLPEGADMASVRSWIEGSMAFANTVLGTVPGVAFSVPKDSVVDGVTYLNYSTTIDFTAMSEGSDPTGMPSPMVFSVWMTQNDGMLLLEMGPRPAILPSILAGTVAEPVSGMEYLAAAGTDKEIVMGMEMAGYTQMIMQWAGPEAGNLDMSSVASNPAWVWSTIDLTEGGMSSSVVCDGSEVASFIGGVITASGGFGSAAPSE